MTPATSSSINPAVRIRGLHKTFGKFHVHKGLDLDIPEGKVTYIMGGSGTGKSLLLKQIMGFIKPDEGTIEVHGERLDPADEDNVRRVRKQMGILFQNGALFDSMSVYDNVSFALRENLRMPKNKLDERVAELLESVGLTFEHSTKMPSELSGGQRKRVALARALALTPSIMMYDEPTTGLDPITTEMVTQLIKDTSHSQKLTTIVISHDTHVAFDVAEHLAFLKDGVIRYVGEPNGVFKVRDPDVQEFFAIESKYRGLGG